ncbi:biotin transporter BioY [Octadecabacter ascidiaceicola]|uniref:Biotin transporter n=1 Tax=Octadecabacter ascidiaceicola TaxID=1655543 RepID=A0A238K4F2_9RHOB|nr:biotin transporter BioY [Octadecabacter ascidiaceicola]SMX36982.1 Biotin transporter BioY [Octadecabacter ascidiaceicola]
MSQAIANPQQSAIGNVATVALAVGFITLSAKISIPFWPVPMTMQVATILLVAGLGGLRFGVASVGAYLAAGAAGLPVFAGTPEKGVGLVYMFGPTGGYLFGFLVAAILVGWATDRFGRRLGSLSMPLGLALIYALGVAWLAQFVPNDKLFAFGIAPFLFGDLCKVALAAFLVIAAPATLTRWVRGRD